MNVTDFTAADVSFAGSTVGGTLAAAVSGGPATYNVAVSGMTSSGNVVASIPAGVATDGVNTNQASTSTDNTVAFVQQAVQAVAIPALGDVALVLLALLLGATAALMRRR